MAGPLPITFLSDYGVGDDFAGVCRAVIARIAPGAQVIDITHGISRHDVRSGAAVLADAVPFAPLGVHLAIVDPGVGGPRRAVAVRTAGEGHLLVGPDNGLLPPAIDALGGAAEAVDIGSSPLPAQPGLGDLPRARHVRPGCRPPRRRRRARRRRRPDRPRLARPQSRLAAAARPSTAPSPTPIGSTASATSPSTSRSSELRGHPLAGSTRVSVGCRSQRRIALRAESFGDVEDGAFLFYEDSSGRMALAINRGSAAEAFEIRPGDEVELEPAP